MTNEEFNENMEVISTMLKELDETDYKFSIQLRTIIKRHLDKKRRR